MVERKYSSGSDFEEVGFEDFVYIPDEFKFDDEVTDESCLMLTSKSKSFWKTSSQSILKISIDDFDEDIEGPISGFL